MNKEREFDTPIFVCPLKNATITPEEFANRMQELHDRYWDDEEMVHGKMDDLLCELLRELGYGEGVDIFDNTHKWYA